MNRTAKVVLGAAIAGVLMSAASLPVLAQRRAGRTQQAPQRTTARTAVVPGAGLGLGYGGWWTRVTPTTPEEKAFVERISALHNELRQLVASGAPADQIAAKRAEIHDLMLKNTALVQKLAPTAGRGWGRGAGLGYGGWWTRVTPTTPEEKAFVERISALHNELRQLVASGAPADQIAAKRAEIHDLMLKNTALVQKLAPTAGRGWGRGRGFGMGLNPYCPFAVPAK